MRRVLGHIAVAFLVVLTLSGCHRKGRIIPAKTLENIYVEMFLADQWLRNQTEERPKADTTLFYEPVFRRYGFTSQDYDVTVSYYIDRPDKYVKILRRVAKDLNIKHLEYNRIAERIARVNSRDREGYGYRESDFHNADSILFGSLVLDSLLVRDSVYIKEPEADTLAIADSLASGGPIVTTQIIEVPDVERRDRVRPDKKPTPGKFAGHKSAPVSREAL